MGYMKAKLWRKLPSELLDRSLSYLPVPALCRFRAVCKRWNLLICKPEFGARCLQNAQHDACYLVARYTTITERPGSEDSRVNHGWSLLDVNAGQWYTIKDDPQEGDDKFIGAPRMATDGGLVCQIWDGDLENFLRVVVSNPVSKTSKMLPPFPFYCLPDCADVSMVVNSDALTYKVFVMLNHDSESYEDDEFPMLVIYDSETGEWERGTTPTLPQITEIMVIAHCCVFHDGLLYILTSPNYPDDDGTGEYWIWSYDDDEETWDDTGVVMVGDRDKVHMFVCDDTVFLGSWLRDHANPAGKKLKGPEREKWSYEIGGCDFEEKTYSVVFQRPRDTMAQVFDVPGETLEHPMDGTTPNLDLPFGLTAVGLGEAIVLTPESSMYNKSGVSMVVDPNTGLWEQLLPINPLLPLPERQWMTFGNPMSLTLPANTSWIEDAAGDEDET